MKQTRLMSLIEAIANVLVGYSVAVVAQMLVFPVFGLQATLMQNLKIGAVFAQISMSRSFVLRRLFEAIRDKDPPAPNRNAAGLQAALTARSGANVCSIFDVVDTASIGNLFRGDRKAEPFLEGT